MKERIKLAKKTIEHLQKLEIAGEFYEHEEIITCHQSKVIYDKFGIEEETYSLCKNILLRDKKGKVFFLYITLDSKELDLNLLRESLGTTKLGFATSENLNDILGVPTGSISLFSMINDNNNQVSLIIDQDIFKKEKLAFHPNYSGMTMFVTKEETNNFINSLNSNIIYIESGNCIKKTHKKTFE